jgi:acyl carrier protein
LLGEFTSVKPALLTDSSDLYDAGLTSFDAMQLMMALEDRFAIELPERMLNRRTFKTIANMSSSVDELVAEKVA